MLKFNMGCGRKKLPGFVNVDSWLGCEPDELVDLEQTPWPWPDNCASEVLFVHSLEHLGGSPRVFLGIMSELYRICAPDAVVRIHVPHPRHDNFLSDPTHVRPILGSTLALFDRRLTDEAEAQGGANTPLAQMLGVDFRVERTDTIIDEPHFSEFKSGRITEAELMARVASQFNVARELRFTVRVKKAE